jgi:hypothetical protein
MVNFQTFTNKVILYLKLKVSKKRKLKEETKKYEEINAENIEEILKEINSEIGEIKFHDINYDEQKQKELLGYFYKEEIKLPIFSLDEKIIFDFPRFAFVNELKETWHAPELIKNITFLGVTGSKIFILFKVVKLIEYYHMELIII